MLLLARIFIFSSSGVGWTVGFPSISNEAIIESLHSLSCVGFAENQWSGPLRLQSRVKCFSKNTEPSPHAIDAPVLPIVWSENPSNKSVKIIEAQLGSILKENDIVRYQDVYGRVK